MTEKEFVHFLQYCLDERRDLPASAKGIDWIRMMDWAERQAIVGVIYEGIQRAGKVLGMPFDALMEWVGYAQQIETQNRIVNKRCVELTQEFMDAGFDSCILKGQGNALMYPNPLMRMSGDIDILLLPRDCKSVSERRKIIGQFVNARYPGTRIRYQHIDYPKYDDVEVEVHFIPTAKNNPIYNKRIQEWVEKQLQNEGTIRAAELSNGEGVINVPSADFNLVYLLSHMMHHFFDEGIGLRQFVDYYYLLKSEDGSKELRSQGFRAKVTEELKWLNLYQFAGSVMYVEKEVLGLDERYLIVEPDGWRGKTLLDEILKGGNFGRSSNLDQNSTAKKYFQKIWRNMHFVRQYPAEALCEPVFRTWHFFWRIGV